MINKEAKSSREKRKELNLMKKRNLSLWWCLLYLEKSERSKN
jgi:hypothetical protein